MPVAPVLTIGQALTHLQVLARSIVVELDHPQASKTHALGVPIKLSKHRLSANHPAPMLGEHSRQILTEFGLAAGKIDELIRNE